MGENPLLLFVWRNFWRNGNNINYIEKEGMKLAKKENTETKVRNLLLPIVEEHDVELVDVEFVKEGPNWYLRVYLDKEGGIGINDCALISRQLDQTMGEDFIEHAYVLEVSSPGLDRPLKKDGDFVKFAGHVVDVKLYRAVEGKKEFQGVLKGLEADVITIFDEDEIEISFIKKDVASIRLAITF